MVGKRSTKSCRKQEEAEEEADIREPAEGTEMEQPLAQVAETE